METSTNGMAPQGPRPPAYSGFAEIVADAIVNAGLRVSAVLPSSFLDEVVEKVDGAHQVRVRMLEHDGKQAKKTAGAYAAMDRAHQTVLQYVKRVMGQTLEVNARQAAEIESVNALREAMRVLWERASLAEETTVPLAALQQLVEWEVHEVPQMAPTIVGMAVDHSFTHGTFQHARSGQTEDFTFLGWSLVIRHLPYTTTLEPTFLRPLGEPATRLAMSLDGWELQKLH